MSTGFIHPIQVAYPSARVNGMAIHLHPSLFSVPGERKVCMEVEKMGNNGC